MTTPDLSTPRGDAETVRAIVSWLRETAGPMIAGITHGEVWVLHRAADAIERGAHLKGQDHG